MIRPATLALLVSQACAAMALADGMKITHAQGETAIDGTPETVMVTDWAAFDNLTALGVPVAGVPGSNAPGHLADRIGADMRRIGSLQEPDIETIAATAPDLVIIAARSRNSYKTISAIAPTLDMSTDNAELIDSAKANLTTLGAIFHREDRAAELNATLDAKVAAATEAATGKGTALVIVTNGGKMGAYGPGSRISWLYSTLKVPSVFDTVDDRDHGGDSITFEYLLKTNPDWLFVVDRDAAVGNDGTSARQILDNELIHQTNFWQNGHVVYLDSQAAYVTMNGYDALTILLDQVTAAFNEG